MKIGIIFAMEEEINETLKYADIINEYETSKGKTVITHNTNYLEVGQIVEINSVQYKIKEIIFSSVPNEILPSVLSCRYYIPIPGKMQA